MTGRNVVTGGAGFVGTNVADRLLRAGERVVVLDDLSRAGVDENLRRLQRAHGDAVEVVKGDVRDPATVRSVVRGATRVFHFAAQVAVTTSVDDPVHDFGVNLGGTVTLLEELRRLDTPPTLLFTSTNKVYGGLEDVTVERRGERYEPADAAYREHGIGEDRPLRFSSPYGCSKGGADQYVLDYAKSYGLPTVVFRMSCIYGPHQCGNEDQGWVAHFLMRALDRAPITLYGDGRQVRDVLFVDDLVDAMLLATDRVGEWSGEAFNIGGGPASTVSLLELLDLIGSLEGRRPEVAFGDWRIGDQRWYVSDTRRFADATGWRPRVGVREGVERLHAWLRAERAGAS
ncbi:MAG TPA: SDR family NAD(P)-dependent oxidoreductase [Mycobacteriales bacterium]|jgi:CDP-paratose 2-epimerase|nr:SDR family NAD(P)-dependent oxidoreductase [Mycobacteriales bacterium]